MLLSSDVNCSELSNGNNTVEWFDSEQISGPSVTVSNCGFDLIRVYVLLYVQFSNCRRATSVDDVIQVTSRPRG